MRQFLLRRICDRDGHRALLTFMITDGSLLLAHQGGRSFTTARTRAAARSESTAPFVGCESLVLGGAVNHLLVSSEPMLRKVRQTLQREIVCLNHRMELSIDAPA